MNTVFSVGCRARTDLRYVYENHEEFMPLPTYAVAPGLNATGLMGWPGWLLIDLLSFNRHSL